MTRGDLFRWRQRGLFIPLMLIPTALFLLQALMDWSDNRHLLASRWLVAAVVWLLATLQGPQDAAEAATPAERPSGEPSRRD